MLYTCYPSVYNDLCFTKVLSYLLDTAFEYRIYILFTVYYNEINITYLHLNTVLIVIFLLPLFFIYL